MTETTYVTREMLMSALDVKPSAYMSAQIDRACRAGSRAVEGLCHRTFYPQTATRTFDYPGPRSTSLVLWLDDQELHEVTALSSDDVTIPSTDYFLRPDFGPPFNRIEIDRDSTSAFAGGPQRAISVTGVWAGAPIVESQPTQLAAAVSTTTATTIDVDAPAGGIGSVLRIRNERMIVTEKSWVTSAVTTSALAQSTTDITITTGSAALFTPGERLLIDAERLEVLDVTATAVIVRRAVDGTPLAAHTNGTTIYWQHRLVVERGALGSTAATQLDNALVYLWEPPSAIAALAMAYAEDTFLQENSGYARTSGEGENERPVVGRGIKEAEARVRANHVRSARVRAV